MLEQRELVDPVVKDFVECLSQQISELELLKAMYPNEGEITLPDKNTLEEIKKFIDGNSEYFPSNLEFVINLTIDHLKLEVCVNLPVTYPSEEPDIYIRCNQLNRPQETLLNSEVASYIKSNHIGNVCIYNVIDWIQENIETIVKTHTNAAVTSKPETDNSLLQTECFKRFWIYSHHIYNKKKREEIMKKSKELQLTGFCLPGKPGVICIEGDEKYCKEWWQDIKSMTWKKIMIRKTESFNSDEHSSYRRFNNFEELRFQSSTSSKHANMGEFSKFMNKHGCSDIFSELFGLNE